MKALRPKSLDLLLILFGIILSALCSLILSNAWKLHSADAVPSALELGRPKSQVLAGPLASVQAELEQGQCRGLDIRTFEKSDGSAVVACGDPLSLMPIQLIAVQPSP